MTSGFCRTASCLAFAACVSTGCSTHRDPTVQVMGAKVVDASAEGLQLEIALEVTNHGNESIRLDEFEYRVSVDGAQMYAASWSAEATLASNDVRNMPVPAVVRFDAMGWPAGARPDRAKVTINGTMSYIAPGPIAHVFRDMGIPNPKAAINGTSEIETK